MESPMVSRTATAVRIRPATAADRPALAEMLARCTESTRSQRFLAPLRSFPEPYLTEALAGHPDHFALVAATPTATVALASCRATAGETADLGVLVEDAWQRQGIGTSLLTRLLEHADRRGLRTLKATMAPEQDWIMWALRDAGTCTARLSAGALEVTVRREPPAARPPRAKATPQPEALAPGVAAKLKAMFAAQGMMGLLDAEIIELDEGRCVLGLTYRPELSQQHGYFHGGAIGAIADVAGGYAACTMAPADTDALTVEYKVSLFAPARGPRLEAVGEVLRPGRLTTCLVNVFDIHADGTSRHCATALQTVTRIAADHQPAS
jgi:uncharacterized protein (TIGR00369 family)